VSRAPQRIAVAIHAVEPATFERCALIRDWLEDHGVDRATLLVIPARDLHPLAARSPEMVEWLIERARRGDAIAQHGFQHVRPQRRVHRGELLADLRPRHLRRRGDAEFVGLDAAETRRAVESGWRLLKLAGIEPGGFVAPAYAYTPALRDTVSRRFRWWAELLRVGMAGDREAGSAGGDLLFPPIALGGAGTVRRALTPPAVRVGSLMMGSLLRLDLHPRNLETTRQVRALEWVLRRSAERTAVTYDELAGAGPATAAERPPAPEQLEAAQRARAA